MPHSARRVLCTPVLRSLRSRSWLNAQMTEVRSAETCSSTCLILRESDAPFFAGLKVSTEIPSRITVLTRTIRYRRISTRRPPGKRPYARDSDQESVCGHARAHWQLATD